jgi:predicted Zn-dependent protease with MMP-like domain
METELFEELVAQVVSELPEFFQERLDNVDVIVEEFPDRHTMRLARVRSPYDLLGFYHGVPLTERTTNYGLVAPDKISIYRRPIEIQCRSDEELREMIRRVVLHEIAHHFGISDNRLRDIGAY